MREVSALPARHVVDLDPEDPSFELASVEVAGGEPEPAAGDELEFDGARRGESWLEALEEHAAELGPAPEHEVVVAHRGHRARGGGR